MEKELKTKAEEIVNRMRSMADFIEDHNGGEEWAIEEEIYNNDVAVVMEAIQSTREETIEKFRYFRTQFVTNELNDEFDELLDSLTNKSVVMGMDFAYKQKRK